MVYDSILDFVGNTPMIRLSRMADENSAEILAKFEGLNVGGSIKTRTAFNMILDAEKKRDYWPRYDYCRTDKRQPRHRPCSGRRCERI